jgi:hypothetical protein
MIPGQRVTMSNIHVRRRLCLTSSRSRARPFAQTSACLIARRAAYLAGPPVFSHALYLRRLDRYCRAILAVIQFSANWPRIGHSSRIYVYLVLTRVLTSSRIGYAYPFEKHHNMVAVLAAEVYTIVQVACTTLFVYIPLVNGEHIHWCTE